MLELMLFQLFYQAPSPKLCPTKTLMQAAQPLVFAPYNNLSDEARQERIRAARAKLGKKAVILCHHYQRADIYQHADLTGDSLKLSRLASQTIRNT